MTPLLLSVALPVFFIFLLLNRYFKWDVVKLMIEQYIKEYKDITILELGCGDSGILFKIYTRNKPSMLIFFMYF